MYPTSETSLAIPSLDQTKSSDTLSRINGWYGVALIKITTSISPSRNGKLDKTSFQSFKSIISHFQCEFNDCFYLSLEYNDTKTKNLGVKEVDPDIEGHYN